MRIGDWHQVERFDFQRPSPIKSDINAPSALINRAAYSACLAVVLMGCHQTSHTHAGSNCDKDGRDSVQMRDKSALVSDSVNG